MGRIIAVTGKGGVGKTTVSALLVRRLVAAGLGPVLAIDADPNSCLDAQLGVKAEQSVGRVREEIRDKAASGQVSGISKKEMLQLRVAESLVEADGFDLIAMGRPEGAGCYCYANNVLKAIITQIAEQYPFVVLDNEAGLENLSRRIVQKVNTMVMVSDPSNAGLETLKRLHTLSWEMGIKYDKLLLVVNRLRSGELPAKVREIAEFTNADTVLGLPDDEQISRMAESGAGIATLQEDNPVLQKIDEYIRNQNFDVQVEK
jgi:CO dehydrogenase maturation factor